MEKNFSQKAWIADRPLVKHFNPDGVCATLVSEWLAAGGKIAKSNFMRGTKTTQSVRVVKEQHSDRDTVFLENGLSPVGSSLSLNAQGAIDHVCTQQSLYYFALRFKDGSGHALGVINQNGTFSLFDPNVRANESLPSALDLKMHLLQLVLAYMNLDLPNWDHVDVYALHKMTLNQMAFMSRHMS